MIDFHIAVEIARKYYAEKGQQELTKVYDAKKDLDCICRKERPA